MGTLDSMGEWDVVQRHIAEGQARIARQIALVDQLSRQGDASTLRRAIDLLAILRQTQQIATDHVKEARARGRK
jgi:hypothetical protein